MHTIRIPLVVTQEDKRRAAVVRSAEEGRIKTKTPDFVREGLGACRNSPIDPDNFTNDDTRGASGREARNLARAVCRTCPFAEGCLPWAMESGLSGIFGGEWLRAGRMVGKE